MSYVELQITTHFSFLRGASGPEELLSAAALLGITTLGVTDRNSLAGIVRAHEAAKVTGVNLIVGCRLDLEDFPSLLVYPTDRKAYARLCRLLTIGKGRAGKGKCQLFWKDVQEWSEGLIAILVTKDPSPELATHLHTLRSEFGDRAYCALTRRFRPNDLATLHAIAQAARLARVPAVVTGDVLFQCATSGVTSTPAACCIAACRTDSGLLGPPYAAKERRLVLACIRPTSPFTASNVTGRRQEAFLCQN
jgi:error-prone DNA polymerase